MPEMVGPIPRDVLLFVCAGCGIALYSVEVAGEIDGKYADYEARCQGPANFVYCGDCWKNFKTNVSTEVEDAIEKRERIFETDNR